MFGAVRALSSTVSASSAVRGYAASSLVYLEHADGAIVGGSLSAVTAAQKLGGKVTALVSGSNASKAAEAAAKIAGVEEVLCAESDVFDHNVPENVAPLLAHCQEKGSFSHVLAASSSVGKSVLPRLSAQLDVQMIGDVTSIEGEDTFVRPIYAGNAMMKVESSDKVKVLTVRPTAFEKAATEGGSGSSSAVDSGVTASSLSKWLSDEVQKSDRPELTSASIVVSGGRGVGSAENFDIIYKLADKMGAAVGASRAAVDNGYCPNEMQVGQTGKVVAPEFYLAIGISGAIQHLAGMKDSKVIACINKDPEAPIFHVSDYGLVADLFEAVPELMEKL